MHRRGFIRDLTALALGSSWTSESAKSAGATARALARPASIIRPALLWSDEFDALNLSSPTRPGTWRPNEAWQDLTVGYHDFAGDSWNVNPNQAGFEGFSPFSADGTLTITNRTVPPPLVPVIRSSLDAAGHPNLPVPRRMGGMLITDPDIRSFRYGYFEVRVRFPVRGRGMFPAIWLFRDRPEGEQDKKAQAEIDLFEVFGEPDGRPYHATLHRRDYRSVGDTYSVSPQTGERVADAGMWHVIGLDWQPGAITFLRDHTVLNRIEGEWATWFDQSMSIRMNYAADGHGFGRNRTDESTPERLTMEIDYIRVYDRRV